MGSCRARFLRDIQLFHTDRGSEFKNQLIDKRLAAFQIGRSLSMKGYLMAQATFKIIKTEFMNQKNFGKLEQSYA